jgi:histidinol-phosphate aminotransferase
VLERLAAGGIAVRRCDTFPGLSADHLRFAVCEPSENQRLLDAIRDALL